VRDCDLDWDAVNWDKVCDGTLLADCDVGDTDIGFCCCDCDMDSDRDDVSDDVCDKLVDDVEADVGMTLVLDVACVMDMDMGC
jgi:hypothetical protein